jgi:hypothetical protein
MGSHRRVAGYFRVSQAREGMSAPELYEDEDLHSVMTGLTKPMSILLRLAQ